jgi:hypothetical protein
MVSIQALCSIGKFSLILPDGCSFISAKVDNIQIQKTGAEVGFYAEIYARF